MQPAERQNVYDMFRDGKSYTEIAVQLRMKRNQVASVINKGRERGEDLPMRVRVNARGSQSVVFRVPKSMIKTRLPETLEGIALIDTDETHCREMIGHMRCCGKTIERISYCKDCAARNYA